MNDRTQRRILGAFLITLGLAAVWLAAPTLPLLIAGGTVTLFGMLHLVMT